MLVSAAFPQWQRGYLDLLAGRDLPTWGLPATPGVTARFMRMLAALHGQTWNASRIGSSMGLDQKTVNTYLNFLEGAFLVRRLYPYARNVGKRLVKTPKLYWRDSGLLHVLLNVGDWDALLSQPWVGESWEGFVIEQVLSTLSMTGRLFEAHYFRTSDQHEIDLVLDMAGELTAIEIKLTSSPSPTDVRRLDKTADMVGAKRRFLVCRVEEDMGDDVRAVCNLEGLLARVAGELA